jgi:hypothetical protein
MLFILRQTLRRLIHQAGFTATILLTLCLCIGANVAIYAVVDAILVRPLPFPDANRLVAVHNSYPRAGAEHSSASMVNYYDRRHAIKAIPKAGGPPVISRGRAMVVYVRSADSPTGWASLREMAQAAPPPENQP